MFVYLKYLIIRNYFFILNHLIQSQVFLFIFISYILFLLITLPFSKLYMYLVNPMKPLILLYPYRFLSDKNWGY